MLRTPIIAIAVVSMLGMSAAPGRADWPAQGLLVAGGSGLQLSPLVCGDGAGGALVSWLADVDGTSAEVRLQRFAADGSIHPSWPASGLLVGRGSENTNAPLYTVALYHGLAADGEGGAYVLWHDRVEDPAGDFRVLRVDGAGQIVAGWPTTGRRLAEPPIYEADATLLADGTGGVFAAWCDLQDGDMHVRVQHFQGDGTIAHGWPSTGVRPKGGYWGQSDPALALDDEGGVWVGWHDQNIPPTSRTTHSAYYQQTLHHVTAAGIVDPALPTSGIPIGGYAIYPNLTLVRDGGAGTIALWAGYDRTFTRSALFAQRIAPGGADDPGWPTLGFAYAPSSGNIPRSPVEDGHGGAFVAWSAYDRDADLTHVRAQHVHPDATVAWDSAGVMLGPVGYGAAPVATSDGIGGAVVVWTTAQTPAADLFAQRVRANGSPALAGGPFPLCTAPGAQGAHQVVADGAGGAYAVWVDQRSDNADVYLGHLTLEDLPTPTFPSLVTSEADEAGVRLEWFAPETPRLAATLYRSDESDPWHELARVIADGTGMLRHLDRTVEPGRRYGYRLGIRDGSREVFFGEAWVTTPEAPELALIAPRPNPRSGRMVVSFTLPTSEDATLELIDPAGRVVLSRRISNARPGRQALELSAEACGPGLYFVRLGQGRRGDAMKTCVVR